MLKWTRKRTDKNAFTRKCIGEAVVYLLKKKSFEKITVTDIALKSGISRMTFYHYYASPMAALEDYFSEIVSQFIEARTEQKADSQLHSYRNVLFALNFFDGYADFFLTLVGSGLYCVIINTVNDFMSRLYSSHRGPKEMYELYYYAGALLNIFIKWEEDGKTLPAEEIAQMVSIS